VVRAGSADLGFHGRLGARGGYLDNVRINHLIFFDNNVKHIDTTNFCLLSVSVSIVVVELYTSRHPCREWSLCGVTTRVLPRRMLQLISYRLYEFSSR
jgi:hypothetical protein